MPTNIERTETEFNRDFIVNMIPKLEWCVFSKRTCLREPFLHSSVLSHPDRFCRSVLVQAATDVRASSSAFPHCNVAASHIALPPLQRGCFSRGQSIGCLFAISRQQPIDWRALVVTLTTRPGRSGRAPGGHPGER